jgi:hypothetical protein
MLTSQRGKEELLATLKEHAGMTQGNLPPFGTLLVETILNYEYPSEAETAPRGEMGIGVGHTSQATSPALDLREPGDLKFAQPAAQEASGG